MSTSDVTRRTFVGGMAAMGAMAAAGIDMGTPVVARADEAVRLFCEDLENYAAGRPLARLVDRAAGY